MVLLINVMVWILSCKKNYHFQILIGQVRFTCSAWKMYDFLNFHQCFIGKRNFYGLN